MTPGFVTIFGAEREPPYERPPLSKAFLRGEAPFEKALVRAPAFYAEHGIETMFGTRVAPVDTADRVVELEDHRRAPFDTSARGDRRALCLDQLADEKVDLRSLQQISQVAAQMRTC
jgi:NADPH-dependent 2,4-dienoyl-CoA reductase/sulfur reductase-like enzyme